MTTYRYSAGEFQETQENHGILVADSFLVAEGLVRSLDKHLVRFIRQATLKTPDLISEIPDFLFKALALMPKTGNQFPRLEIQEDKSLKLQLRPAPELTKTATLWTYPEADPRSDLSVKGPELDLGTQIRAQAQAIGADEAVILNQDGFISEGALSSLVWWEGDTLVAPGNQIPWLESVTRTEIFEIAEKLEIETKTVLAKPQDLIGKEVWQLSSLQGIRLVTNWIGLTDDFANGNHVEEFEAELNKMLVPLP
ncbi:MAG: hypothetical protein EBZ61_04375 [Micrococcales bacterium]|nr:hypothetical protein [Micrococcales bacterium]